MRRTLSRDLVLALLILIGPVPMVAAPMGDALAQERIKIQLEQVEAMRKLEKKSLPVDIDYNDISNLRIEARQKLSLIRPENIGQASRISGVSPADISVLLVYLKMKGRD